VLPLLLMDVQPVFGVHNLLHIEAVLAIVGLERI
jgi:hypothetical protein